VIDVYQTHVKTVVVVDQIQLQAIMFVIVLLIFLVKTVKQVNFLSC